MKRIVISKVVLLSVLFFAALFATLNFAQAQKVESLRKKIDQLTSSESASLKSLAYDLQPSVTVVRPQVGRMSSMSTTVENKGPAPRVARIDGADLGFIDQLLPSLNSIELLQIKVGSAADLKIVADLTVFVEAPQLKYVLFVFEYDPCQGGMTDDCVSGSLKSIKGLDQLKVPVLYEKSIPQ